MPTCTGPPAQGAFVADRVVVLDKQLDQESQQGVQVQVITLLKCVSTPASDPCPSEQLFSYLLVEIWKLQAATVAGMVCCKTCTQRINTRTEHLDVHS